MNRRKLLALLPLIPLAAKAQQVAIPEAPLHMRIDGLPICEHEWLSTEWSLGYSNVPEVGNPPSIQACGKCGTLRSKDFIKTK